MSETAAAAETDFTAALREVREHFDTRLGRVDGALEEMSAKLSRLPGQVRTLGTKIDSVSSALGETNYRALVKSLVSLYVLVEQMPSACRGSDGSATLGPADPMGVVTRLLWQTIEEAGVSRIPASGAFDPNLHCAVDSTPADVPAQVGQIRELVRSGFAVGPRVLQPAQVVVWGPVVPPATSAAPERDAVGGTPEESGPGEPARPSEGEPQDTLYENGRQQDGSTDG